MTLEEQRQYILEGHMYNDLTVELIQARENAILASKEYNASFGQPAAVREALLRTLLCQIGTGVHFEPDFRCEFGFNIRIGNKFYANFDCVILDGGLVEIGDNVLLGPRVGIYTSNHAFDANERASGGCVAKPVKIGNDVWVGGGCQINPGVTIGDGAIIGSGSVVTHDIPPRVIAAGVPCEVLREVTEADRVGFQP
ncbi:maltose O-acetyltransferase [Prosthecobacter fusiformis]|uniref:Acetyltransferase n=1 Tax=Prosthecobacter fusiformis TaxID=48464 RepID=A0A4R7S6G7_9BACT|nr:sugar O-acetyltransferase [Prosthecobacter fusiformis]TDU73158.1 maltose O-acetyltransferase [Prosthecobacter fusiformis]